MLLTYSPVLKLSNVWFTSDSEFCCFFQSFYGRKPHGLSGALEDLGIHFSGRQHSGLDDARNTAKLTWKMIQDGCVMKVTKCLDGVGTKTGRGD